MNIVNVGYDSTNYYVLADARPRLLIDVGFGGTMPKLQHQCKRAGLTLSDIPYLFCTHYHPDHAGLAEEVKRLGVKLLILDLQIPFVPALRHTMKPEHHYQEIDLRDAVTLTIAGSRAFLAKIGIHGELIHTPYHSDDSVTLILDEGAAFTGDLVLPMMTEDQGALAVWARIRAAGVKQVYGGHGPAWKM